MTAVRLLIETRSAAIAPGEALARAWRDAEGDLFRSVTQTYHFVGGGSYYRTLVFSGFAGAAFEETDTDFDPGTDYGTPADPYITYTFADPITQTDLENYVSDYEPTYGDWETLSEYTERDPDAAHAIYETFETASFATAYDITRDSGGEEGDEGFRQAVVFFQQVRLTILTDVPAKVRLTNGDDGPTTETLEPGVELVKDVKLAPGAAHQLIVDHLQWLPWSGALAP